MHIIFCYLSGIASLAFIGYFISPCSAILILTIYLLKQYFNGPCNKNNIDLTNKVVVITGGCGGIGFETAVGLFKTSLHIQISFSLGLAKLNATIVICGRMKNWREALETVDTIKKLTKNSKIQFFPLDLDILSSVEKFIEDITNNHPEGIDILINNAGVWTDKEERTAAGIEMQFGVNHLAHFKLTLGLLDLLQKKQKCRIINLSSKLYKKASIDFDQIEKNKTTMKAFNASLGYSNSKFCNILFTQYLALRLKNNSLICVCVHPGVVRSNILKSCKQKAMTYIFYPLYYLLTKSVYLGAQTTIHCCTEEFEKLQSGAYYADCKQMPVSHKQINLVTMKKLWEESLKLCNVQDNLEFLKEHNEVIIDEETKKNK